MSHDDINHRQSPVQTIRDGTVSITLWERHAGDKPFLTASISKGYQDRDGNWRESRSLGDTDLLKLQSLIPQARAEIKRWQEQQRVNERFTPSPAQQHDMVQERDAAMQAASRSGQQQSRWYERNRGRNPDRGR